MKNFLRCFSWFPLSLLAGTIFFAGRCVAQDNVWLSTTNGNWQDTSWSLGILPATNQTIWLTNAGWKAVQISPATAQFFPQSMNVNALNISSPVNSFNTFLLNYAGAGKPLTVKSLSVANGSTMTVLSSALQHNGSGGTTMSIGGTFNQTDSIVSGNQVDVGYTGNAVYNFNSGFLSVSNLWLGGNSTPVGILRQNGGTNAAGITHLDGGLYVLSNGFFGATIYFNGGEFRQEGGVLTSTVAPFNGTYVIDDGIHQGDFMVPTTDGFSSGSGSILQNGGTNSGTVNIGTYGSGSYTLIGGVSFAGSFFVDYQGSYFQWGGTQSIAGMITVGEQMIAQNAFEGGSFGLFGGLVSANGMSLNGYYAQSDGTNRVAGDVTIQGAQSSVTVSGGLLTANNLIANPGFVGGVFLNGGTMVISNELQIGGNSSFPQWQGFVGGGQLIAADISLTPQAIFSCRDGAILQSGTLTLASANLYAGSNSMAFGRLCLSSDGSTNSTLFMPDRVSIVHFADSSSVVWSNAANLVVDGWSGHFFGGGQQQIIFGNSASGLTSGQLGQIQFRNPAGVPAGMYTARILATGEVVPKAEGAPPDLRLIPQPAGMQVTLQGEIGSTYSIEASTDAVHWVPWTNEVNSTGTMTVTDTAATNYPARFYRARLMP